MCVCVGVPMEKRKRPNPGVLVSVRCQEGEGRAGSAHVPPRLPWHQLGSLRLSLEIT